MRSSHFQDAISIWKLTKITFEKRKILYSLINKRLDLVYFCGNENGSLEMRKHSWEAKKRIVLAQFNVVIKASMRAGDNLASSVQPRSNAPNSEIVNLCCTIHNLTRIMSGPHKNHKVTNNNIWNSWSRHYTHNVAGWRRKLEAVWQQKSSV